MHMLTSMTMHDQVKLAAHYNSTIIPVEVCRQCNSLICTSEHTTKRRLPKLMTRFTLGGEMHIACYEALFAKVVSDAVIEVSQQRSLV